MEGAGSAEQRPKTFRRPSRFGHHHYTSTRPSRVEPPSLHKHTSDESHVLAAATSQLAWGIRLYIYVRTYANLPTY